MTMKTATTTDDDVDDKPMRAGKPLRGGGENEDKDSRANGKKDSGQRECKRIRKAAVGSSNREPERKKQRERIRAKLVKERIGLDVFGQGKLAKYAMTQAQLEKRLELAREQERKRKLEEERCLDSLAFDPLDPIAMLKATREQREHPRPSTRFEPKVLVEQPGNVVPLSYQSSFGSCRDSRRDSKDKTNHANIQNKHNPKFTKSASEMELSLVFERDGEARERMKREESEYLFHRLKRMDWSDIVREIENLDDSSRGEIAKHQLKQILSRREYGLNPAQVDRLLTSVQNPQDGNLLKMFQYRPPRTSLRRVLPRDGRSLNPTQSLPILHQHCLQPGTRRFGRTEHRNTSYTVRPPTGSQGFYPDDLRFHTSRIDIVNEDRYRSKLRREAKAQRVAAIENRMKMVQQQHEEKYCQSDIAKLRAIDAQRQSYLAPLREKAEQDQRLADRPRGKRLFLDVPLHLQRNSHQIEQRMDEKEGLEAHRLYEDVRGRSVDWQRVFNIKQWQLHQLHP